MKIKDDLPQFIDERALIIATSETEARFFLAHDGEIDEEEAIKIEKKSFSDDEGRFDSRTTGPRGGEAVQSSGGVKEDDKHDRREFLQALEKRLTDSIEGEKIPTEIFLFTPDYLTNEIRDAFPAVFEKLIVFQKSGDYTDEHPFDLLKKIQKHREEREVEPMSEEAANIYDIGNE